MQCSRCEKQSITRTRGENFCGECYDEFVMKKVRAIMGPFRVIGLNKMAPPTIIVFTSFGASSLALIDLLVSFQQTQRENYSGMVGFNLECVHFGPPHSIEWPWPEVKLRQLPELQLPEHEMSQTLSRSTKHDMHGVLLRKAALNLASSTNSVAAFGYSMTKLSELTLAETVKGRGAAIPSLVSPDIVADRCIYPLREITLPELETYCNLKHINHLIKSDAPVPGITKMQSIDEIVREYFAEVRKNFPSVVSTVSKVASRLSQPSEECALCNTASSSESTQLCYACKSALNEPRLSKPLDIVREYEL